MGVRKGDRAREELEQAAVELVEEAAREAVDRAGEVVVEAAALVEEAVLEAVDLAEGAVEAGWEAAAVVEAPNPENG